MRRAQDKAQLGSYRALLGHCLFRAPLVRPPRLRLAEQRERDVEALARGASGPCRARARDRAGRERQTG